MGCRLADSVSLFMNPQPRPIRSQRITTHFSPVIHHLTWDRLLCKGEKQKHDLFLLRRAKSLQAVATSVVPASADGAQYRKQLAESCGFRQIGEPLPRNVTLKEIIDTLPRKGSQRTFLITIILCTVLVYSGMFSTKYTPRKILNS